MNKGYREVAESGGGEGWWVSQWSSEEQVWLWTECLCSEDKENAAVILVTSHRPTLTLARLRDLSSSPGIEPWPWAVRTQSSNHWTARNS